MRTIFTKANDLYCSRFQLGTSILEDTSGNRLVRKYPLCQEAKPHLQNMKQGFDAFGGSYGQYPLVPVRENGDALLFAYISGENGTTHLLGVLHQDGTTAFLQEVKALLERTPEPDCLFTRSAGFCACFGDEPLPGNLPARSKSFLDFTSGNIILHEGQWIFIDYEWFFSFPVPVDLLKVHFVECLYTNIPELPQVLEKEQVYAFLGLENIEPYQRCRDFFLSGAVMNEDSMSQINSNYLKPAYPLGNSENGVDILQTLKNLEEQRDYQAKLLQEQQRGMAEKDDWIVQQESMLEYQSQVIAQREDAMAQKGSWIAQQESMLEYQRQVITQREDAMAQKDSWIAQQESMLEYQRQVIAQRENAIFQKDDWIAQQEGMLEYQRQVIAQGEDAIAQKDDWIAQQESMLEYQSQVIAQGETALRQKDLWIQEQGIALAKKAEEITQLEEKIEAEHRKRLAIQERLYAIENSKFWQYTAVFHKKLDEKDF